MNPIDIKAIVKQLGIATDRPLTAQEMAQVKEHYAKQPGANPERLSTPINEYQKKVMLSQSTASMLKGFEDQEKAEKARFNKLGASMREQVELGRINLQEAEKLEQEARIKIHTFTPVEQSLIDSNLVTREQLYSEKTGEAIINLEARIDDNVISDQTKADLAKAMGL